MADENNNQPEKIALTVEGKSVEKTLDELKALATTALTTGDTKTYTVKVDGEEKSMTLQELMAKASEAAGAQKKFAEASELRTKAQRGLQVLELIEATKGQKNPDPTKAKELMTLLGVADDDINEVLSGMNSDTNNTNTNKNNSQNQQQQQNKKVSLDELDPRVRAAVEAAEANDLRQIRENVENESKKIIDNDKVLGKIVDELPDDAKARTMEVLYGMMIDDVKSRILGREAYGTEMLTNALQKVRARVQSLGLPTRSAGQAPVMGELGISAAISPEIQATEPIRRVKSSDAGYEDNAIKRMQQLMYRAAKTMGRR